MKQEFHAGNRSRLYAEMKPNSLLVLFAGEEIRKTNDEYYPFFTDRDFLYLTGIDAKQTVLLAIKDAEGKVAERAYILPPDAMIERWSGRRLKAAEVEECSGIRDIRYTGAFEVDFHTLATSGNYLSGPVPGEPCGSGSPGARLPARPSEGVSLSEGGECQCDHPSPAHDQTAL